MTYDRTPCPQRTGALPCVRSYTDSICVTCRRDLPATHPTSRDQAAELFGSCRPSPTVDRLPGLQAQLAVRHDLPMRVVVDILDEVVPMLELLARVREIVDTAKDGPAIAWLRAFGDVRDALYPDTDVARTCREQRASRPERAAAAEADERAAWAGIVDRDVLPGDPKHPEGLLRDDHVTSESPLVESPPAAGDCACTPGNGCRFGEAVPSYPGEVLDGFLECKGCAQPFPACEAHQLRVKGKLFAFHPGQFCPDCAAKYTRGELLGDPLRPCAECGRLTQYELCSQCADPDEAGHV